MTIELLPCPHCGSPASIHTMPNDGNCNDGGQFVMCDNSRCMAASALVFPLMDSAEPLLAERWNRRVAASTAGAIQPHLDHQVGAPVTPLPLDSAGGAPSATAPREHEANEHCWCEPEVDYVDPNTGAKVFVHKQTQ